MTSWGADPKLLESLQRQPTPKTSPGSWVTNQDYPDEAVRAGQSGSVVVRFTIGTDGGVSDCVAVVSSGFALLDKHSCRIFTSRARYEPALAADGRPVAVKRIETIHWVLPQ